MKTRKTNSLVSLILARPLPRRLADARVGSPRFRFVVTTGVFRARAPLPIVASREETQTTASVIPTSLPVNPWSSPDDKQLVGRADDVASTRGS